MSEVIRRHMSDLLGGGVPCIIFCYLQFYIVHLYTFVPLAGRETPGPWQVFGLILLCVSWQA